MSQSVLFRIGWSAILFAGLFLWLWLGCPQYLMYQEQNQLFLFTWNYFTERMALPGGFADWLSEFVVQFYYIPLYGALLASLMLTLVQVFLGLACRHSAVPRLAYILSALPSVLCVAAMGDENILLSLAVAIMLTSLFTYLSTLPSCMKGFAGDVAVFTAFCILYWLAGPIAFIFIVAYGILRRESVVTLLLVAWLTVRAIHWLWLKQYPFSVAVLGINYYRIPQTYPAIFWIILAVTAAVPLITLIKKELKGWIPYIAAVVVMLFAVIYVPASFDKDKSRVLALDSLVRQGRWTDIIALSEKERPSDIFSLQALNLALGMTGQMTERMFHYDQKGIEGLIGSDRLDNTSQLVTAEALYRLGLTNIAFSTTFDMQEAIMNDRKSGRHMKRLAECMIVNGNYDLAAKYIGFLEKSLFYKDWAQKARALLGNDTAVEAHPVYGPLRRNAFSQDAFYVHGQIEKILAMLAMDGDGSNPLAWDYFCAASMLKGDIATLAGVCNFYADKSGQRVFPRHVQEALAIYWTSGHQSFEGLPFQISPEVKRETAALAKAAMSGGGNPNAWRAAAPDSYGVYFLSNSSRKQPDATPEYQQTHE